MSCSHYEKYNWCNCYPVCDKDCDEFYDEFNNVDE
jgi:hypothetical protein